MNELEKILMDNYKRYPKAQIEDYIKLIFQNEFAGGHMIKSAEDALSRLQKEYKSIEPDKSQDLKEYIGYDIYRINLGAVNFEDLEDINSAFVKTANETRGSVKAFEEKLSILRTLIEAGNLPFDLEDFDLFMAEYKARSYPAISHSEIYRESYRPAYRVIGAKYI